MNPVADCPITTPFHKYGHMWSLGWHTGADYACPIGTDVLAPISGYVARAGWDNSFGNFIIIRCVINNAPYNVYLCHLSKFLVKVGEQVLIGQHVAESGNTGNTTGPHCHLEVRKAPYGFNPKDIVDPKIVSDFQASIPKPPVPGKHTVFDVSVWNPASPRWYKPWAGRAKEIQREIRNEASIYFFQEVYSNEQINTIKEALPTCDELSGPAGLECFYDRDEWNKISYEVEASGIQGRFAQAIVLENKETGRRLSFVNTHGPVKNNRLKEEFERWLIGVVKAANADVVVGDFNRSKDTLTPRKGLHDLGYRNYKDQANITNESVHDFIPKNQDLCEIYTRPAGPVDIVGGEVDITTNLLESDHRRIEARIVAA